MKLCIKLKKTAEIDLNSIEIKKNKGFLPEKNISNPNESLEECKEFPR